MLIYTVVWPCSRHKSVATLRPPKPHSDPFLGAMLHYVSRPQNAAGCLFLGVLAALLIGLFAARPGPIDAALSPAPGDQLTLTPTDDAFVAGDLPSNNYGLAADLVADASPVREGYLKFDLQSLAGQNILSAKLRMWVTNGSGGIFSLKSVADSWSEGSLNYSNAPPKGAVITSFSPSTVL